jgi:hypothetical protein
MVRLRQRKRLLDVAHAAHCSEATVRRVEHGEWTGITYGRIIAVANALGVHVVSEARWFGAALDRVLDEGHAQLVGFVNRVLTGWGWETRIEVSFSIYGERGSIDLLAWHAATRTLVVFEIKTELGSVEGLLRPLGVKARLAKQIAHEQFAWQASHVAVIVVFPETMTARRTVMRHADVLTSALPARSRAIRSWLRRPDGSIRGCWFLSNPRVVTANRNPAAAQRVRVPQATALERGDASRSGK